MNKLYGSVGWGGRNTRDDVALVQTLLNQQGLSPLAQIPADGICGLKTLFAIKEYQRRALHGRNPDGLIAPHGPTWRFLAGGTHELVKIVSKSNELAKSRVTEPAIRATLDVLGYSEGAGSEYGTVVHGVVIKAPNPKDVGRRDVIVTDFSRHPDMLVQVNAAIKSTAAGRYQFLSSTWKELGMADFTPASQDIAAVKLFQRRKMVVPLMKGDFETAVQLGSLEWASLPDSKKDGASHYGGQPARSLTQLKTKYAESFGLYAKR